MRSTTAHAAQGFQTIATVHAFIWFWCEFVCTTCSVQLFLFPDRLALNIQHKKKKKNSYETRFFINGTLSIQQISSGDKQNMTGVIIINNWGCDKSKMRPLNLQSLCWQILSVKYMTLFLYLDYFPQKEDPWGH